jgi:hypothetical protein
MRKHHGFTRIKTCFLLFPKKLRTETRWLEVASWKQRYRDYEVGGGEWKDVGWVEEAE